LFASPLSIIKKEDIFLQGDSGGDSPLRRRILIILVVKCLALLILWQLFFSDGKEASQQAVADHVLSPASISTEGK
jgi:hypothetical protein